MAFTTGESLDLGKKSGGSSYKFMVVDDSTLPFKRDAVYDVIKKVIDKYLVK